MNQEVENQIGGAEATIEQNQEAAASVQMGNDLAEGMPVAPVPIVTVSPSVASVDGEVPDGGSAHPSEVRGVTDAA